jgi:ABC-type transporter Mla MlaB component
MNSKKVAFARGSDQRKNATQRDPRIHERACLVSPAKVIFQSSTAGLLLDISKTGAKINIPGGGTRVGQKLAGEFFDFGGSAIRFAAEIMHWSEWTEEAGIRFSEMNTETIQLIGNYISDLKRNGLACIVTARDRKVIVQGALTGKMTRPFLKACEAVNATTIDLGLVVNADSGGVGLLMIAKERWGCTVHSCPPQLRKLLSLSELSAGVLVQGSTV